MTELPQQESSEDAASGSELLEEVLREFAELDSAADPLRVELVTSEILGEWWEAGDDLAAELIEFAAEAPEPERLVAPLAALRSLAPTEEQREAAGLALDKLGLGEPDWARALNQVQVGECWRTSDVYGDETSVLCVFGEGESAHGLLVSIGYALFGGWADEAVIVESPAEVISEMQSQAAESGNLVTCEPITPGRAHQLLADAFVGTELQTEPEVTDDYVRFRALAMARTRSLPEPEPVDPPRVLSAEEEAETIDEFFRAALDLEDTEAARVCALRLIEFGMEHDPRTPLRVGPDKLASFVDLVDDGAIELTDEQDEVLDAVLPAWARWGAQRDSLPADAVEPLIEAVEDRIYERSLETESSLDAYLEDAEDLDEQAAAAVLERRQFAIPSVYTEIAGEEVELDPSDPEQRRLLVIGEHPDFQDSLAEDDLDEESFLRLAAHTTLVDQLWDDEPAEVWQAAQRLLTRGLQRTEVIAQLAAALEERLETGEGDGLEFDLDDYLRALEELG
ncbi:hypothetical protein FHX82_000388 [Amycolatopsis bartoniae]|uniref:Uncharacterized protein n=1 Tax=Amycolatopsis bartoniae TaxID=941986 RepID=A0A8H9ITM5_9PSEU|nr:hypothetical protein [Amycolatopsis bartoniae]MBB2933368.1 hypothetical protein [Amycolatopsis bartoniae]TVT08030.1 hypothetical protein FNH07_13695 [Amycolatopsis bartoniae]GHF58995.1 hypothetical protein GCM10017566_35520 [Amycolatopsis bartoniae]